MAEDLLSLMTVRRGHFRLESGHHGDLWLDIEPLFLRPEPVARWAGALARRLAPLAIDAACGPLVGGAFVAHLVAAELGVVFSYAEPVAGPPSEALYPVRYRVPRALRGPLRGKRIAIINDVTNAGSAVRGTHADLRSLGAEPVAIGTLLVLGTWASDFAAAEDIPLASVASLANGLWPPASCPLCAAGVPLDRGVA